MISPTATSLQDRLAKELTPECRIIIHHLSTVPTQCSAIFASPPNQTAGETYCENQLLSIAIDHEGDQLQVFAIEVLIYTTKYLTTLFVSKADSTGYLHLLNLPKGTPSPLRTISTTFLKYLVDERRRPDRRLVLSLFARAQNQYLFSGSIENSQKHVLDDRGLIKWWCRVVNPILGVYQDGKELGSEGAENESPVHKSNGFLRVPGCDKYETRSFFPKQPSNQKGAHRWTATDPLRELAQSPDLPERCLIPRFPDDPKARFVEALDDELPGYNASQELASQSQQSPSTKAKTGRWRSVKSLDQFWELMSFRQECSSGRLVGFIWAVFIPSTLSNPKKHIGTATQPSESAHSTLPAQPNFQNRDPELRSPPLPFHSSPPPESPLTPQIPQTSQYPQTPQRPCTPQEPLTPSPFKPKPLPATYSIPSSTKHYYWPPSSRGEILLSQKDYNRTNALLLRLDYANKKVAADSTRKWGNSVAARGGVGNWGRLVVGEKVDVVEGGDGADTVGGGSGAEPVVFGAGVVRKRRVEDDGGVKQANVLSEGLVRKKAKTVSDVKGALENEEKNGEGV